MGFFFFPFCFVFDYELQVFILAFKVGKDLKSLMLVFEGDALGVVNALNGQIGNLVLLLLIGLVGLLKLFRGPLTPLLIV